MVVEAPTPGTGDNTYQTGKAAPQNAREPFDNALALYLAKLMEVSTAVAERQQQALLTHLETVGRAVPPGLSDVNEAEYQELISAIDSQDAVRIAAAQTTYLDAIRKLQSGIAEDTQASLGAYLSEIHSIWEVARAESDAGYQEYIGSISKALGETSANDLDPAVLATIGHALSTVASYAGIVRNSLPGAGW
jgi:hypothetical protein